MGSKSVIDLYHLDPVESFHRAYDAGTRLVIHKASQGLGADDKFHQRLRNIEDFLPELAFGAYHWLNRGSHIPTNVRDQFEYFKNIVPNDLGCYAMDLEYWKNALPTQSQAEEFAQRMLDEWGGKKNRYGGSVKLLLYSRKNILQTDTFKIEAGSALSKLELWIADYRTSIDQPSLPKPFEKYRLWQYVGGEMHRPGEAVPGLGYCDRNIFRGSTDDVMRWLQKP